MGDCKRNCWTCGLSLRSEYSSAKIACASDNDDVLRWKLSAPVYFTLMPPKNADGCPGWKPKEGAEVYSTTAASAYQAAGRTMRRENGNTDRAQVAALSDSATIRPDSATAATVKDSLMVGAGWRGNLPICRGPGGIAARRMRRAGLIQ